MSLTLSPESSFSLLPMDAISNASSNSASLPDSTPPTTISDSSSMHSDSSKHDTITLALDPLPTPVPDEDEDLQMQLLEQDRREQDEQEKLNRRDNNEKVQAEIQLPVTRTSGRSRRSCAAAPVYNLSVLSGTSALGKKSLKEDLVTERSHRRRTIASTCAGLEQHDHEEPQSPSRKSSDKKHTTIDALDLSQSSKTTKSPRTRRQANPSPVAQRPTTRRSAAAAELASLGTSVTTLGKRIRRPTEKANPVLAREMRRLQDTKEFSHVDDSPVIYTVWANGKYVNPNEKTDTPARKKAKTEVPPPEEAAKEVTEPTAIQKRVKKYLDKGLYAGQDAPLDITKGLTPAEKKQLSQLPELLPKGRPNKIMPAPMFTGLRALIAGADFKLPYHVCNPLPPGQPKPDEWRKMTKNRFIGESRDNWRKSPHFHDMSKCVCKPEDGCAESCQNRIMLYECDEQNCNVGKEHCTNRAFAELTARRNKGGKYRVGVEVIKTGDRGYGVRSNRCFEPHQIIMEYAGEIITEEECERRMNEIYKHNECYYLMSFDQNMIIDATTGSIARFVNHSCNPNCRMIKWIVSGQPRMALFAGDRPIMTGDELTYDYNFDPFSSKNVQKCLCGAPNCRGILGPKKSEPKTALKNVIKDTVKAGKRKLQELVGGDDQPSDVKAKKPKIKPITSTKEALAMVGMKVSKGAATALKRGMSTIASNPKKAVGGGAQASQSKRRMTPGSVVKKTSAARVTKTYKQGVTKKVSTSTTVTTKTKSKSVANVSASKKVLAKKVTALKTAAKRGVTVKTTTKTTVSASKKKTTASRRATATNDVDPYEL